MTAWAFLASAQTTSKSGMFKSHSIKVATCGKRAAAYLYKSQTSSQTAALTTTAHAGDWTKAKGIKTEKAYGIAKAGKNDCATKAHQCAGQAKVDNDPSEWIFLPAGVSAKIAGASLKAAEAKAM